MEQVKVESEIKKWGNSLALRVTGVMAELPQFTAGTKVVVEVTEEGITVKPVREKQVKPRLPYSERSLLAGITPELAHAEDLASPLPGEFDD